MSWRISNDPVLLSTIQVLPGSAAYTELLYPDSISGVVVEGLGVTDCPPLSMTSVRFWKSGKVSWKKNNTCNKILKLNTANVQKYILILMQQFMRETMF